MVVVDRVNLGGRLEIDFTGVSFANDSVDFDFIAAGSFDSNDFSRIDVFGLDSNFSFTAAKRIVNSETAFYTGEVQRNVVNTVLEPATWLLMIGAMAVMVRIRSRSRRGVAQRKLLI